MIIKKATGSGHPDFPPGKKNGTCRIDHQNWVSAPSVNASFDIQHDGTNIWLQYYVTENEVRAVNSEINSSVWEDSCVEFFVSFKGDEVHYYNFEFNAIGTVLGAYGKNREERTWLPAPFLNQVERISSLGNVPFGKIDQPTSWNLSVKIPVSSFCFNSINDLTGVEGRANFYKCGDLLTEPHFLSWKPVRVETPDFHRPEFFDQLTFQ